MGLGPFVNPMAQSAPSFDLRPQTQEQIWGDQSLIILGSQKMEQVLRIKFIEPRTVFVQAQWLDVIAPNQENVRFTIRWACGRLNIQNVKDRLIDNATAGSGTPVDTFVCSYIEVNVSSALAGGVTQERALGVWAASNNSAVP